MSENAEADRITNAEASTPKQREARNDNGWNDNAEVLGLGL